MQEKKKKRMFHLGRKVTLVSAALIIISMSIVILLCVSMFRSHTMDMLQDRCVNGTNILSYQLDNYYGPEDKTQLLDHLHERMGCEFTIFKGNERAYTTIQQDGSRVVGTKLSDELTQKILTEGQSYVGKAEILGVEHLCSYVPTKDANGQIDGLIFAGISMENANNQIQNTIRLSIIIGTILVVLSIIILTCYIGYFITKPLSKLTKLAQTMEQGNLGLESAEAININIRSNDEIGLLANTFEQTIQRLKNYIGEISSILESISHGNLRAETNQNYVGDFTSIKNSLDGILLKLNNTMSQIAESSDYVSCSSEQMAIGAQALSQGAVEQASSIEQLDCNIREISEQVEQTADNATQTRQKVTQVSEQLLESNEKMQQMIEAMQEINERSNEISKIISTIENISAQTNILAINAAVEASRAGEFGRGFAVVADEIRALAAKSSEASQSTTTLIEHSIESVKHGTEIANETATQLVSVVSGAQTIVNTTNEIADAARTQADSIIKIQEQISQISNVVQTNSATSEESAATSQQLNQQAGILKNLIGMFHLK